MASIRKSLEESLDRANSGLFRQLTPFAPLPEPLTEPLLDGDDVLVQGEQAEEPRDWQHAAAESKRWDRIVRRTHSPS